MITRAVLVGTAKLMPDPPAIAAGVDAHDLAGTGHERPAGVARVERRVGLDQVLHQTSRPRPQRLTEGAHYASGHGVLKAGDRRSQWRPGPG